MHTCGEGRKECILYHAKVTSELHQIKFYHLVAGGRKENHEITLATKNIFMDAILIPSFLNHSQPCLSSPFFHSAP